MTRNKTERRYEPIEPTGRRIPWPSRRTRALVGSTLAALLGLASLILFFVEGLS
jgi:hypothetical protein